MTPLGTKTMLALGLLLLAAPLAAQTGSGLANMHLADTKNKDPGLVAAQHLARAEQALAKAEKLDQDGGEDPRAAKRKRKEAERAEREASAALAGDPGLIHARFVRGRAHLLLGDGEKAREDCLQVVGFEPANAEALLCYGRASLLSGEGGQGLSAYARLRDLGGAPEMEARLLAALKGWIAANPEDPKAQNASRWLEQEGEQAARREGGS